MATEIEQDLVIPAYTNTELTVKKVKKGMQADFGTINLVEGSNGRVQTITIYHNLGATPESFYLFPNGDIETPTHGEWGGVSIRNDQMYGESTFKLYDNEITIHPTSIDLQKTATYIKVKITDSEYVEYSFYTGSFAWIVM